MCKTTLILAGTSLILGIATLFVGWRLFYYHHEPMPTSVGGAHIQLGIPGLTDDDKRRLFRSGSALLYDTNTKAILFEQSGFERKPIASITKLMTAMIAMDTTDEWTREISVLPQEYVQGGNLTLYIDETITLHDALAASLIGSANNATLALVRELGIPEQEFIQKMNRRAVELGLEQTEFVDTTGLDPKNVSTAYEVAILANTAFNDYPEIAHLTAQQEYTFTVGNSSREHTIQNTDKLLREWGIPLSGSKTGYLYEAGFCLVVKGSGENENRIAVILDGPSEIEHFADMKKLLHLQSQ